MHHAEPHPRRFLPSLAALALLGLVGALLSSCGGSGNSEEAEKADKAYQRFDRTVIRTFNRTDVVQHRAFVCLSNAPALGGPELAKCEPVAQRAAKELRRMRTHLGSVYRSSPAYIRRIFRRYYRALRDVLNVHAQTVDAMAEYAQVHGASSYVGAEEFEQIKLDLSRGQAADRKVARRLDKARARWHRYAKRRWDLQYGSA